MTNGHGWPKNKLPSQIQTLPPIKTFDHHPLPSHLHAYHAAVAPLPSASATAHQLQNTTAAHPLLHKLLHLHTIASHPLLHKLHLHCPPSTSTAKSKTRCPSKTAAPPLPIHRCTQPHQQSSPQKPPPLQTKAPTSATTPRTHSTHHGHHHVPDPSHTTKSKNQTPTQIQSTRSCPKSPRHQPHRKNPRDHQNCHTSRRDTPSRTDPSGTPITSSRSKQTHRSEKQTQLGTPSSPLGKTGATKRGHWRREEEDGAKGQPLHAEQRSTKTRKTSGGERMEEAVVEGSEKG